jgi:uncharacterized protein (TIGR03000 family)
MNHRFLSIERVALALLGLTLTGGPLRAQSGTYYPYWGSAPGGYRPADNSYMPPLLSPGSYYRSDFASPAAPAGSPAYGSGYIPYLPMRSGAFSTLAAREDLLAHLPGGPHLPRSDNKAYIWLSVPTDAKVWFDGETTNQTGEIRHFYTPALTPGKEFVYSVRVRWTQNGKPVERTRRVTVRAKDRVHLDFLEHDEEKTTATTRGEEASPSATVK